MGRGITILATAAVAAVLSSEALGSTGSISDPAGDVFGNPPGKNSGSDIVRATHGHASGGRLRHTVVVDGRAANPDTGGFVPLLYIDDPKRSNGTSECDYVVARRRGVEGVFTCGYLDRVASAGIARTGRRTLSYVFRPGAIGNPRKYGWAFEFVGGRRATHFDRAPNYDPVWATHRLR